MAICKLIHSFLHPFGVHSFEGVPIGDGTITHLGFKKSVLVFSSEKLKEKKCPTPRF
jgi:hypothetical protein